MSALNDIIQNINQNDNADKGSMFETLCLYFLRHDKLYSSRFSDVWLWDNWPGNEGNRDTGIDIVAKIRNSGTYCAIQCKFHEESNKISKGKIDSFISASSKNIFSERILISLYGNLSKNAAITLEDQNIPARNLTLHDLENSSIDWSAFNPSTLDYVRYNGKNLRDD